MQNLSPQFSDSNPKPDWLAGGFGLYVHWPFCAAKCPYCDFNSHVVDAVDHAAWAKALVSEVHRVARETGDRRLSSIYFGGGTPSLMEPSTVAQIIDAATARWTAADDIEITLEANPTSVEAAKFEGFKLAGVNRVSLGVQSLSDKGLKDLGRLHSVDQALDALEIARSTFNRVSFDLIYARQHQSIDAWLRELTQALSMEPDHLSLYQLTIEPGTAFGRRYEKGNLPGLPTEDAGTEMYEATQAICADAGILPYEVSNYARPGAESRHNLVYWRYGDYAGIGPGAHGRLTLEGQRFATQTVLYPQAWLERTTQVGHGELDHEALTNVAQAEEYALMSLRLTEGLSRSRYESLAGAALNEDALQRLQELGLIQVASDRIQATPPGRLLLNSVLADLLADP